MADITKKYYKNTSPTGSTTEWRNTKEYGETLLVTITGGDGSVTNSQWEENSWTKYWSAGARGVSVNVSIQGKLIQTAQGGAGNPQNKADEKRYVGEDNYKCGRYWYGAVKWCSRPVYEYTGKNNAKARAGSGDTKSFIVSLRPNELLSVQFVGNSNITNTRFNGSVMIARLPDIPLLSSVKTPSCIVRGDSLSNSRPPEITEPDSGNTETTPPSENGGGENNGQTDNGQTEQGGDSVTPPTDTGDQQGQTEQGGGSDVETPEQGGDSETSQGGSTEQGQTEQGGDSQTDSGQTEGGDQNTGETPPTDTTETPTPPENNGQTEQGGDTQVENENTPDENALSAEEKALARAYLNIFNTAIAWARSNPNASITTGGRTMSCQEYFIFMAKQALKQVVSDVNAALDLLEPIMSYINLYTALFRNVAEFNSVPEEANVTNESREKVSNFTKAELESAAQA